MNDRFIDLAVVAFYLVAITLYGLWIGRGDTNKTKEGYYLGGRSFNWVLVGFSLFATNISIGAFVGGSGLAYKAGFAAIIPEINGGLMLVVSAVVFMPVFLRSRIFTIPQFLQLRYNTAAKILFSGLFVCQNILLSPLGLYTGAIATLGLFGWELTPTNVSLAALTIACTVGLYATMGGLKSVVVTDAVQVIIMLVGGLRVAIVGVIKVGGFGALHDAVGPEMFEMLRPRGDPYFPWDAAFPGQLMHAAFYAFCNIALPQRALGSRDLQQAQKGMLFGAFLKLGGILPFAVPGLVALVMYPDAAPDTTYAMMVRDFLPVGISGLVLAGLLAAMMSSQDSSINAIAGLVALDIWPLVRPKASDREAVIVGKTFSAGNLAWGVIAAPFFLSLDQGIYTIVLKVTGFMILPTGVCYLWGRYSQRVNGSGAVATLLSGLVLGVAYIAFSTLPSLRPHLPDIIANAHFYHIYPVFFIIFTVILYAVSLLTPAPAAEKLECIRKVERETITGPKPVWYRSFNFWLVIYLCCFTAIWIIF